MTDHPTTDRSPETGLTPRQERAALLLTSGRSVQEIADELGLHRSTLWAWRRLETFQAHLNALKAALRLSAEEGLLALQEEALAALRRVMSGGNDGAALKAATYVLAAARETRVGSAEARELVRQKESEAALGLLLEGLGGGGSAAYERRCRELGIAP